MTFGLTGRHSHRQMLWGDVEIKQESNGNEFLELTERATKTKGGQSDADRKTIPKIYAMPGKLPHSYIKIVYKTCFQKY